MKKKKTARILIGLLLYILAVVVVYMALEKNNDSAEEEIKLEQMETKVSLTNGMGSPENESRKIQVEEDDTYNFYVNCKTDREGILTGCWVQDEKGTVVFACSGEEMEVESSDLELKSGNYTVEFYYLTSQEAWNSFMEDADMEPVGEDEYTFQDNGEWDIWLEYGLGKAENHTPAYFLGMACGLLAGLGFVALMMWIIRKAGGRFGGKNKENSFDERQLLARGQAYKYAFFTMAGYMVFVGLLKELANQSLLMSFAGLWIGVCLSIAVFAVVCILKDAYMNLYENAKGVIMMFSAVGLINLVVGMRIFVDGKSIVENGTLSVDMINMITGFLFVVILIVFIGRVIYNNRQLEEDEE